MSDDILHTGRADIHHPKGPLTAEPAAQQPLSRDDTALAAAIAAAIPYELIATPAVGVGDARRSRIADAVMPAVREFVAARDARVRADERRCVAEEIAAALDNAVNGIYIGVDKAVAIAQEHAAPAERVQDGSTDTTGTPDPQRYWWQHDDCDSGPVAGAADWPGRPCTGCGMSLGGWTRGAPIAAGSVPSLPEETPDA